MNILKSHGLSCVAATVSICSLVTGVDTMSVMSATPVTGCLSGQRMTILLFLSARAVTMSFLDVSRVCCFVVTSLVFVVGTLAERTKTIDCRQDKRRDLYPFLAGGKVRSEDICA